MTGRGGARRLLLVAIVFILIAVLGAYRVQKRLLQQQSPQKPAALPSHLNASAEEWRHTTTRPDGRPLMSLMAKDFRQVKATGLVELDHVEVKLHHEEGDLYDFVKSARAEFRPAQRELYSEGDVEIILGVPAATGPTNRLVSIRSSAVTFDTTTGRARTERPATFAFENGDGSCVGASYDPQSRELLMYDRVTVNLKSQGPRGRTMKVESEKLSYKEALAAVMLYPWSRLTQENSMIEAGDTIVVLENGAVKKVESNKAKGEARYPNQKLEYDADHLWVEFTPEGVIEKVIGEPRAHLVSTTPSSRTTVSTNRIDLEFETATGESVLKRSLARGNAVVESTPAAPSGDVRILRSDTIVTNMRPGGEEIEGVNTDSPGEIEFVPRVETRRRRMMKGERLYITYGPGNQIKTFRSINVATRTEPRPKVKGGLAVETWSKDLLADFDPKTGEMKRLEQWQDFRYQEGERRARAGHAVFEPEPDLMTLTDAARVWDPDGSTSGDAIRLDQKTGAFAAEGHVTSSRAAERTGEATKGRTREEASEWTGVLGGKEPMQATAERMNSEKRNTLITYEGKAVLWQGGNRIQADRVVIDRAQRRMTASGNVVSQLADGTPAGKPAVFTVVKAANMVYTDADRQALYTGGAVMNRPGLTIESEKLRAFLAAPDEESRLERLYADGRARVVQKLPDRIRTGTGDHAEYFALEQRIVLRGGNPVFEDSKGGTTRGAELTYFIADDRLLVSGAPKERATSRIPRK